ncbi:MAG: DUF4407 domain-containing protein [Hyphomicrobiaceae bacterium]
MGAVVFCMERVLVASIRQDASIAARIAALAWRGVIASLAATLVTIPFALAYFDSGILARLDDEKLALMGEKRGAIGELFGLNEKTKAISMIDHDLVSNREQRDQLPADMQALSMAATECNRENAILQGSLRPKIGAANARYTAMLREVRSRGNGSDQLRYRLAVLSKQIADWKNTLAAKARACRDASERFDSAKQEYQAHLDREWEEATTRKQVAQRRLDQAQNDAITVLAQSDGVVARVTTPDLAARIRALGQMAGHDTLVALVLAVTFFFFFLIDIMPVLAKLVMRTAYDRRTSSDYRRLAARIALETAIAESDVATRVAILQAEKVGVETLLRQGRSEAVRDLAALRMKIETEKAEITAPFTAVDALVQEFHQTQARVDDIAERYAGRADLLSHIEAVRESLIRAMQRAASSFSTQASPTPSG